MLGTFQSTGLMQRGVSKPWLRLRCGPHLTARIVLLIAYPALLVTFLNFACECHGGKQKHTHTHTHTHIETDSSSFQTTPGACREWSFVLVLLNQGGGAEQMYLCKRSGIKGPKIIVRIL